MNPGPRPKEPQRGQFGGGRGGELKYQQALRVYRTVTLPKWTAAMAAWQKKQRESAGLQKVKDAAERQKPAVPIGAMPGGGVKTPTVWPAMTTQLTKNLMDAAEAELARRKGPAVGWLSDTPPDKNRPAFAFWGDVEGQREWDAASAAKAAAPSAAKAQQSRPALSPDAEQAYRDTLSQELMRRQIDKDSQFRTGFMGDLEADSEERRRRAVEAEMQMYRSAML